MVLGWWYQPNDEWLFAMHERINSTLLEVDRLKAQPTKEYPQASSGYGQPGARHTRALTPERMRYMAFG